MTAVVPGGQSWWHMQPNTSQRWQVLCSQNCPYQCFCHFLCCPLKMCKNILRDWADISVASIPGPKWVKDPIFVNVLHLLCLALSNCANIRISQFCQMQTSILRVGDDLIFWSNQKFVSPVPGSYFLHNSESKL